MFGVMGLHGVINGVYRSYSVEGHILIRIRMLPPKECRHGDGNENSMENEF